MNGSGVVKEAPPDTGEMSGQRRSFPELLKAVVLLFQSLRGIQAWPMRKGDSARSAQKHQVDWDPIC